MRLFLLPSGSEEAEIPAPAQEAIRELHTVSSGLRVVAPQTIGSSLIPWGNQSIGQCLHKVGGHGQRDRGMRGSAQSIPARQGQSRGAQLFSMVPPTAATAITRGKQQPWMK